MQFSAGPKALNNQYDIRFMYDQMPDGTVQTTCTISYIDPHIQRGPERFHEVARGVAQQSVNDTFNKETGRKVSLARAVHSFPKVSRKAAWQAYLNRKKRTIGSDPEWYHHITTRIFDN
jgi:hypothetical protein